MQGKSVSPLSLARYPQLSVWYQMLSSHGAGVSTLEMKSTASWTTSTMYSLAPMPSNGGISSEGSVEPEIFSPQPEWEKPTTPPCALPHLSTGRSQLGHSSIRVVPGESSSLSRSRQRWPECDDGKPETSTS